MQYQVKLENYQGPLELLLDLIEKNKLDITEISLSKVTDDYLDYLQDYQIPSEQINWFLEIATKLIYIKSQALLPVLADPEDTSTQENLDLTQQLRQYKKYRLLSKKLRALDKCLFIRPYDNNLMTKKPKNLNIQKLVTIINGLNKQQIQNSKPISLKLKKSNVSAYLDPLKLRLKNNPIELKALLSDNKSKEEKILYFLACLELIKKSEIIFSKLNDRYILKMV